MQRFLSFSAMLAAAMGLSACAGVSESELAEIEQTIAYRASDPPSATLVTSQEIHGGGDVHAALVVSGSQQVIYDPSGSFVHPDTRRVGDVIYGVSPEILELFALHQADYQHNAVLQRVPLSQDVAEQLLARARRQGGAWPGFCAANIAEILGDIGPFGQVRDTMWPSELSEDMARLDGVETRIVEDDDDFSQTTRRK